MTDAFDASNSGTVTAINCITCGAALPALAGHRAKSLSCSYCGSVMDRHDGYKLLAQYRDMARPAGPFSVGMKGDVLGVAQTIVGIVGVTAVIEGVRYGWTNYQLYSPTHGYSWLTWNDGHLTHSRKTRDMPDTGVSNQFFPKATVKAGERSYRMFESYKATIHYLEGELTWVPALGDTTQVLESIDPPHGYAVALGGAETEFEFSTYLDRKEIMESFGLSDEHPRPYGVHAIQPFIPGAFHTALAQTGKLFAPIALLIGLFVMFSGSGQPIAKARIDNPAKGGSLVFPIERTDRLVEIQIWSNVRNAWAWYDMELINEDTEETIAEFDGGVEYYYGVQGGESWSEGSQQATFRFKPPAPGSYRLSASMSERGSANTPMEIEVYKNVMLSRYLFIVAGVSLLMALSLWFRRSRFEAKRWGDGDDDD